MNRAAQQEGRGAGAMVTAAGAIDRSRAAELGHQQYCCIAPGGSELRLQSAQRGVQRTEAIAQLATRATLVGMRVPARRIEYRHARSGIIGEESRRRVDDLF